MGIFAILFIAGFLLVFGLLLFYAIRTQRQTDAGKKERASAVGFRPLPDPSPEVSQRIIDLYENPHRMRLKLSHVWEKRFPDGEMYLFDLKETSGDDDTQLAEQGLLCVSPYLQMPRFSLLPRLEMSGKLGKVADRFVHWAASSAGKPLELIGHPEFDRRYWVSGDDPSAIQAFLTSDRLERLASTQFINLEAGGDCFALTRSANPFVQGKTSTTALPDLNQMVSQGMQLFDWLSTSRAAPDGRLQTISELSGSTECPQCGAVQIFNPDAAGLGVCQYCGSLIKIPGLKKLAVHLPGPAASSGEWQVQADHEWIRAGAGKKGSRRSRFVEASGCMLPFGLVWTAFALIFLVAGVGFYLNERKAYNVLTQEGVSSVARVTLLYQDTDSEDNTTYYVGYQYTAPIAGEPTVLTAQQSVPEELYQRLENGMQVEILYAASQPSLSEIKASFGPPGLTPLICIGGMGLLFTGIGIVLVVSALSSMGRALFNRGKDASPG